MSARCDLAALLVCPACHGNLRDDATSLACARCGALHPVRDGIPMLLPPDGHADAHDELDHAHAHKRGQARFFDRELAVEFETTRPHGTPAAYRRLMREKFARGVRRLPDLRGATVLDACCGSGMDAEMLAAAGARVIALDISEGCAQRAVARARRFGLDYLVVVGDVERLPLRDLSVEIAFVHDGLHHLADPMRGVRELARVASRALSVNEPADALLTAAMVRLGIARAREDAGNRVARLDAAGVARVLAAEGFAAEAHRYLMYYRHEPGAVMRLASHRAIAPGARAAARAADALAGRWGNKLQVTAHRSDRHTPRRAA